MTTHTPALASLLPTLARHRPARHPELGRPSAVLVPLLDRPDGLWLLFTERSADLSSHAGQVSFPGGRVEEGESIEAAALREAEEEIGLLPSHVRLLGQLDDCPTLVSGFVISPLVAVIDSAACDAQGRYSFRPHPAEVVALHELPLAELAAPANVHTEERELFGERHLLYWYTVRGVTVWGATARILHQLIELAVGAP
jgi:8-oxo-dGTP pyrophosphatase MutT (NUDIX family)